MSASIGDATVSEWSILDEVPLQTTLSDSGGDSDSEWSNLGRVLLWLAISGGGIEWSLVSPTHIPTASYLSNVNLDRLSHTTLLHNLRCPHCAPNRKPLCNSVALEAHISSAAHTPKIFHCPLAFALDVSPVKKAKRERHFSTLAGLARHLECGARHGGVATFVNVMEYVQDQLRSLGFENVRLLLD